MSIIQYRAESPDDSAAIERLFDRAFGPGRRAKTAERLREGNQLLQGLSQVALMHERVVGSVRMWPVEIETLPGVFLGPIAVDEALRKHQIGQELVQHACEAAARAGFSWVLLVGDAPYFQRFGFEAASAGDIRLPGPVDQRRVLIKWLDEAIRPSLQGRVRIPLAN